MDTVLTPEQRLLRESARSFLAARAPVGRLRELIAKPSGWNNPIWDEPVWAGAAALGWAGLLAPEDAGGAGLAGDGLLAAVIVAEECGRVLYPGPFATVAVVVDALARYGTPAQRERLLPGLVGGAVVGAWAIADGPGCWDARDLHATTAQPADGGGYVISGVKRWVPDGGRADFFLVSCLGPDGAVQIIVPAGHPGVTVRPLEAIDLSRSVAEVEFRAVEVDGGAVLGDLPQAAAQVSRQLRLAAVLQCADSLGAVDTVLTAAVGYAKVRVAFGRPIGAFQAIKHHLAGAATALEAARAATAAAAHSVAADADDAARAVHVAKIFTGEHCPRIVETCLQVFGGIAMTWEHDAHLVLRRAQANRVMLGSPWWHAGRLCDVVGVAG
jgi:alkylation response protein AidB-like acyl-CoA dehydrogenase